MRCRNDKYCIDYVCLLLVTLLCVFVVGCTDDPASADSKQLQQVTKEALATVTYGADIEALQSAQNKVQHAIVTNSRADSEVRDAARLAAGNLILARGRRLQSELYIQALPLRNRFNDFSETLRSAEDRLLEKERIEAILNGGQQEIAQLQQFLDGTGEQPGLQQKLKDAQDKLDQFQTQKKQEQAQKDDTQKVLDDYQARADDLLRQAELASGDSKLKLQQQAYGLMGDRKPYYVQAQASEDRISVLDSEIELTQSQVDNLEQSIQEIQQQINAIETSKPRAGLRQQQLDTNQALNTLRQQLQEDSAAIQNELQTFKDQANQVCKVFQDAAKEFKNIRSRDLVFSDLVFSANLQLAESEYQAAQACSAAFAVQNDMAYRLEILKSTTDQAFADLVNGKLKAAMTVDTQQVQEDLTFYDQAIETYQKAYDAAGSMGDQAQCSVLKSQLLAVNSKMQLAEMLDMQDVIEQAQAKRKELIQQGQQFGVSFTQSETLKLVEQGINYTPTLPVNLDVLAEQLTSQFSQWKQLPSDRQKAAIEANLKEIDELISRYGQTLSGKLEPVRQEMQQALQSISEGNTPGSVRDPNGF